MKTTRNVAGLPKPLSIQVPPHKRQQVPWEEMEIQVDPYSLPAATPQKPAERLATGDEYDYRFPLLNSWPLREWFPNMQGRVYLGKIAPNT